MVSVGIDVSKGKSTVCLMKPFGEIVVGPMEIVHVESELRTLVKLMKSMNGEVKVVDLKELAPLLNGMRTISRNINQIAKKANETNSIYVEDIATLKGDVAELCRTVNLWLSTVTSSKR